MKKTTFAFLLLAIFRLPFSICHSTNWLVGPAQTYTKPSQVASLVQNGDTVSIDAGTYTADVAHWTANNLLLRGVAGYAHLNANNTAYGQKGIWVIGGNNTTVKYIEFSHCHDASGVDKNWAGIRQEGLNLSVHHCYFHDNDNGILAGTLNPSKILIQTSEFEHNGYGDGYSHNLYINHVDTLIFQFNYSHNAVIGHELKSRAHVNYILFNRFSNESTGDASRELDLPDGGLAIVMGNIIEQGPSSTNSGIIGYGLESLTNAAPHEFYMINNTVVNDKSNGTFVSMAANTAFYKSYNNIFAGNGTLLSGFATLMDTAYNWRVNSVSAAGFLSPAGYDYQLTAGSQAIDKGGNAGTANNGFNLIPTLEYAYPAAYMVKTLAGVIDIGAHEFEPPTSVKSDLDIEDLFKYWIADENLVLNSKIPVIRVCIYDAVGRAVFINEVQPGISAINITAFPKGIYFVRANTDRNVFSGKFIR